MLLPCQFKNIHESWREKCLIKLISKASFLSFFGTFLRFHKDIGVESMFWQEDFVSIVPKSNK